MVLVQILSDDKVWAHLLVANLRARGVRGRVGDVSWFESGHERLATGCVLILDLGVRGASEWNEFKMLMEGNQDDWDRVVVVVNGGWLPNVRRYLPSVSVAKRHPDMRKLLPEILEKITDRQEAQL